MGTIMTDEERQAWLAIRKEAGLKIDPETAAADTTALRRALEGVIEQNGTSRAQPSRRAVS